MEDIINPLVKVPEFILWNTINVGLNAIKINLKENITNNTETESFLYQMFSGVGIQKYEYYRQAKSLLIRDVDAPRTLDVEIGWNMQKNDFPTIFITQPSEQEPSNLNGMGSDVGFGAIGFDEDNLVYQNSYVRTYQTTYQYVIISDNSNEVTMLYHLVKAILLSLRNNLHTAGLQKISVGGGDLNIKSINESPKNVYMKSVNISFSYDSGSPSFNKENYALDLTARGIPVFTNIDDLYYGGGLGLNNI